MKPKTSKPTSSGIPRTALPMAVIRNDLANGCIPPSYLDKLLKTSGKIALGSTTSDLATSEYADALAKLSQIDKASTGSMSFLVSDKDKFVGLATEILMCSMGSVAYFDLGTMAQMHFRSIALGVQNNYLHEYLMDVDYLFVDALVSPVITDYIQSSPAAAHDVYKSLKTFRYSTRQHLVLDCSAFYRTPTGRAATPPIQFAAAIEQVYGYDTAHLLLNDSHSI